MIDANASLPENLKRMVEAVDRFPVTYHDGNLSNIVPVVVDDAATNDQYVLDSQPDEDRCAYLYVYLLMCNISHTHSLCKDFLRRHSIVVFTLNEECIYKEQIYTLSMCIATYVRYCEERECIEGSMEICQ